MLYNLSDFIDNNYTIDDSVVSYWYQGHCPVTGSLLKLPRTNLSEAVAYGLMKQLKADGRYSYEGKMYGILLVETSSGQIQVLKAFSGLLMGKSWVEGWVGSIEGRTALILEETYTLNLLEEIKQNILSLQTIPEGSIYQKLSEEFAQKLDQLTTTHQHNKQQRHQKREQLKLTLKGERLTQGLEELNQQSRLEKIERRQLKHQRDQILSPLLEKISSADEKIRHLKQRRKILSRQLQQLMSANYSITNFRGESLSLQQLGALPTGTGECCAPKLLHYAATHHLKPVAMAEFWWGSNEKKNDRIQGKFYPACEARCQPIMGFLLSGLPEKKPTFRHSIKESLPIVYEDDYLIIINKPEGLLSVAGRSSDRYDSVISRLNHLLPDGHLLRSVHRLDRDTSGLLLLARNDEIYNHLAQQFRDRKIEKIYQALVKGRVSQPQGTIKLPLWGDPRFRPLQTVDFIRGKESITQFRVIAFEENFTRVEFMPLTGRTHQIRVHCADQLGLGTPIIGDRLYGKGDDLTRLHLHAQKLRFLHPISKQFLSVAAPTPF